MQTSLDIFQHIPIARVCAMAAYFTKQGAAVDMRIYQGLGHSVHPDASLFITTVE